MRKLDRLHKDWTKAIEAYCVEGNKEGLTFEQYKETVEKFCSDINDEVQRITDTKGTIKLNHLKEGVEYNIEDIENDIVRGILIKPNETYCTIIPKYKTKFEYISYRFEKTSYSTAIFKKRIYNS
ncbi:MAG: hypothetical protein ACRCW1_00530 [Anaerotignaceae bacterium]